MGEPKTRPTGVSVDAFLGCPADPGRRPAAQKARGRMGRRSGEPAAMWGRSIVGFGSYRYKYDSGHEGEMARIGFLARGPGRGFLLFPPPPRPTRAAGSWSSTCPPALRR